MGPLVVRCGRRSAAAVPSTALLVVAAAVLLLLTAGPDGAEGYPTYRLCGKHLADILELICKGRGFHDPFANVEPGKRVVAYVQTGRGVSDECCRQGCTRRTMESYCSAEPVHHKRLTPERPEPMGDLRHAHHNGVHPEGRESTEEETAASSSVSKSSSSPGSPSSSPEDSSSSTSTKVSSTEGGGGGHPGGGGGARGGGRGMRGGRRRKDKGRRRRGQGVRERGDEEERGGGKRKGGASGRKCRCKRRRRKVHAPSPTAAETPGGVCPESWCHPRRGGGGGKRRASRRRAGGSTTPATLESQTF